MAGARRGLGRGLGALFGEDTVEEVIGAEKAEKAIKTEKAERAIKTEKAAKTEKTEKAAPEISVNLDSEYFKWKEQEGKEEDSEDEKQPEKKGFFGKFMK